MAYKSNAVTKSPKKLTIVILLLFFVILCVSTIIIIYSEWPPSTGRLFKNLNLEQQLILLVAVCGALGSFIHVATSFTDYLGNKQFEKSWIPWYLLRPFIGATLALSFYFLIRGGLVTVNAPDGAGQYTTVQDTVVYIYSDTIKGTFIKSSAESLKGLVKIGQEKVPVRKDGLPINPFGVAAISLLAGLFSKQAVDKLREIFENLFLTKEAVKRKDPLLENIAETNSDDEAVG